MAASQVIAVLVLIALIIVLIANQLNNADEIDRNLLQAVKGNRGLARRLLNQAKDKYPGKSERWYVEKVIYDLERDGAGRGGRSSSFSLNHREMRENIYLLSSLLAVLSLLSNFVTNLFRAR
jgi:uncharacterized membrane protein